MPRTITEAQSDGRGSEPARRSSGAVAVIADRTSRASISSAAIQPRVFSRFPCGAACATLRQPRPVGLELSWECGLPASYGVGWWLTLGSADPKARHLATRLVMKIRNSLKSAKTRDKNCVVVRRRGRLYVLNKKNPRMKARQG